MSYEQLIREGRWPPTNRETILFLIGAVVGGFVAVMMTLVVTGHLT
ncbi:MAG: hypothetical protein JNN08_03080 [Bryobacterales bacterium]|nr:hypothetical protein [Bryobacterales bacterium]